MLLFVLQWLSLHWEILIMLSQFPLTFHQIQSGCPVSSHSLWLFACWLGAVFVIIWEMFHGRISLNSALLLLLVNFVSGFKLELIYIVIVRSSLTQLLGFWLLVLLPWFIEITFIICINRINLLNLKVKFRQASNCCKRVLEAAKLVYATKTKESITSLSGHHFPDLAVWTFGELSIVFSTKVILLYLLYSTTWSCCLLLLEKQNYVLKAFLKTQSWLLFMFLEEKL